MDGGSLERMSSVLDIISCERLVRYPRSDMNLEVRIETWFDDKYPGFDSRELKLE